MQLLWPLIFLLLLIGLPIFFGMLAFWLMRRWAGKRTVCGKCQYPTEALSGFQCPECGSDFREVGMTPIGIGLRWRTAGFVAAWTLIGVYFFLVYRWQMMQLLPTITTSTSSVSLSGGRTGAYNQVNIRGEVRLRSSWLGGPDIGSNPKWNAEFHRNGKLIATLTVDRQSQAAKFQVGDKVYHSNGELTAEQLAQWIEPLNEHAYKAAILPEAEYIIAVADTWQAAASQGLWGTRGPPLPPQPKQMFNGGGFGNTSGKQVAVPALVAVMYGAYAAIVLCGNWLILRFGRHRLKRLIRETTSFKSDSKHLIASTNV